MLDFSRCRLVPFAHQKEDVQFLLENPYAFIASEMRTGKSKIVMDAAQMLFERDIIDKMIIVAPAPVRGHVWADKDVGQIAKHLWLDLHARVTEFHAPLRLWKHGPQEKPQFDIYVTNYEFIRSKTRLKQLLPATGSKTLLVLDESSFVKGPSTQQTQACMQLRYACGRVVLLNGTPLFHSPLDLFSQGNLLHPSILNCQHVTLFKSRYALQAPVLGFGGKPITKTVGKGKFTKEIIIKEITGWLPEGLEDLQRRFAPYTVRRLQAECLDLPPKLEPVTLQAGLSDVEWKYYKSMRDELVVWLQNDKVATSATAAIKALRLSQMTGGFLSGVEDSGINDPADTDLLDSLDFGNVFTVQSHPTETRPILTEERVEGAIAIGRAKLDVLLWFIERELERDPNLHLVSWSRFRAEALRAESEVKKRFPHFETAVLMGDQKRSERAHALGLLHPETSPVGPCYVAGIEGTGSFGLDMCAAHTCVTLSSGYSFGKSAQTLDRVYGPNQKFPIAYYNIVAVGPKGQKTIDHDILVARTTGEDIAHRTTSAWVKALKDDDGS